MHDGKYTHKDRRERGEDEREARREEKRPDVMLHRFASTQLAGLESPTNLLNRTVADRAE